MEAIDLSSDTVTQPTAEMRQVILDAELGDDVFGDDPTVKRLEEMAARLLGKEAALFVSSGTMANLVAILTHTRRGDEVIAGSQSYIHHELGGAATLGGVMVRAVPNDARGRIDAADVEPVLRPTQPPLPRTALICLENTHTRCGGRALSPEDIAPVAALARRQRIPIHLDGARIFNAAAALELRPADLVAEADSVMFCLSKGLSAPVGSLLCGTRDFIERARRYRKMLGGGMRQVGVVAGAGIVALERMIGRLTDDHANARFLAEGLAALPYVDVDPDAVETNIVLFRLREGTTDAFLPRLAAAGVLATALDSSTLRMVTHHGIERAHIQEAVQRMGSLSPAAAGV